MGVCRGFRFHFSFLRVRKRDEGGGDEMGFDTCMYITICILTIWVAPGDQARGRAYSSFGEINWTES